MYLPKEVISSLVTSFKEDGSLDLEGIVENLKFQKEAGIKSVCVIGGTGEAVSMSPEERHQIMETVMDNNPGLNIVFGALAGTPKQIEEDILKAKEVGADAAMIMAPPFVKPSERDVEKFITDMADLGIPIIIFNSPSRSGFSMSADLMVRLSENENIVGVKESSGDMVLVQDVVEGTKDNDYNVITGGDNLYLPSRVVGVTGGILASGAVIPEVCVALDKAIEENDMDKAIKLHYAIKSLDDVIYKASHPIPLKLAMEYRGLPVGKCRPPFTDISEDHKEELYQTLEKIGRDLEGIVEFDSKYPINK